MKVIGTFPMYVGKVLKNGKMKVLGTFLMGTLEKCLKIKKMKVLGTFLWVRCKIT